MSQITLTVGIKALIAKLPDTAKQLDYLGALALIADSVHGLTDLKEMLTKELSKPAPQEPSGKLLTQFESLDAAKLYLDEVIFVGTAVAFDPERRGHLPLKTALRLPVSWSSAMRTFATSPAIVNHSVRLSLVTYHGRLPTKIVLAARIATRVSRQASRSRMSSACRAVCGERM